jgi:hypothetical protein
MIVKHEAMMKYYRDMQLDLFFRKWRKPHLHRRHTHGSATQSYRFSINIDESMSSGNATVFLQPLPLELKSTDKHCTLTVGCNNIVALRIVPLAI